MRMKMCRLTRKVKLKCQGQSQRSSRTNFILTSTFELDLEGQPKHFHGHFVLAFFTAKVGCVLTMYAVYAYFLPSDHRKDASHFIIRVRVFVVINHIKIYGF